jgi:hypothetical protein
LRSQQAATNRSRRIDAYRSTRTRARRAGTPLRQLEDAPLSPSGASGGARRRKGGEPGVGHSDGP